ncbi:ComF family protein [Sinorhizobium sp. BG8]|uniref:ComF family protein n=1 Tax=Sinorhizobium sp. BG8 TaxID=2613773 RepID=UPI00193CD383|nr:ComF family protein [Sinorhizobium sp. BG8]QRM53412.1 ComF family protein [Sinorhizobium sp. BG8]
MSQRLTSRLRGRVVSALTTVAGAAVDFAYPPSCFGCGVLLERDQGICGRCWSAVRFIERPYCEVLGLPFSHDLGREILSAEAIANPPPFDRLRSAALHDELARGLVHALKYRDRTDLARIMARWMVRAADGALDTCDAIVPVPLHRTRLLWRKFNQSAELARAIGRISGKPVIVDAIKRTRRTRRQVGLGARAREDNVRGAFAVTETGRISLAGKRIVLVDDVYTTGATVSSISRVLKRAGAREVVVLTFARAMAEPI